MHAVLLLSQLLAITMEQINVQVIALVLHGIQIKNFILFIIRTGAHEIVYPFWDRLARNYIPCLGQRGQKPYPVQRHISV